MELDSTVTFEYVTVIATVILDLIAFLLSLTAAIALNANVTFVLGITVNIFGPKHVDAEVSFEKKS